MPTSRAAFFPVDGKAAPPWPPIPPPTRPPIPRAGRRGWRSRGGGGAREISVDFADRKERERREEPSSTPAAAASKVCALLLRSISPIFSSFCGESAAPPGAGDDSMSGDLSPPTPSPALAVDLVLVNRLGLVGVGVCGGILSGGRPKLLPDEVELSCESSL
jgi:hypothetical protein